VVHQFTGAGLAGLTIQFEGATAVTDGGGRFSITGTPSSALKPLAIAGGSIHGRMTFARGSDSRWLAVPGSFDMNAFNDMAREYEPRTIRWLVSPAIYVDTRPQGFSGGAELNQWIQEVRNVAASFVSSWSNSAINAASVTVTSSPPPDGTPGTIVIHFNEDPSRYGSAQTVGLASTGWTSRREILSATIWLRYSLVSGQAWARTAVIGHELGHAFGMGHMDGATPSIMTPRVSTGALTSFDTQAGSIVYSRSPGNTAPDSDTASYYTGALAPAARPAGHFEWVCGAPAAGVDRITP
jgi:hypothetical protein